MIDRTYHPTGTFAPVGVTDFECARVQVWRPGHGWVSRLCPWHQAVVDGVMSDITDDVELTRAGLEGSLAANCQDCA